MKQGVLVLVILIFAFVENFYAAINDYDPRGPFFSVGPIIGFSFTKTPRSRDVTGESSGGATRYDKVGHALNAGFVGNMFYKISKERSVGLQLCISGAKLKDFYVSGISSDTTPAETETPDDEVVDKGAFDGEEADNRDLVNSASLRYMDLLVVFKYNLTWARTAISCGAGISKCNSSPSNARMKTNLGYVINGTIDYNINKNVQFTTAVRLRHHAKKEKFPAKKDSSINNLNVETGLMLSF